MFDYSYDLYIKNTSKHSNSIRLVKKDDQMSSAESGSFPQRMIYVLVYNKYLTSQIGLCSLLYTGSILLSLISNFSIFAFVGSV